jgi:hypothetical protein
MRSLLRAQLASSQPGADTAQLRRVMGTLRDMRWNEAAFDLMRETATMADLVEDCLTRIGDDGALRAALEEYRAASFPGSFAEANAANAALRAALVALIARLRSDAGHEAAGAIQSLIARTFLELRSVPAAR